MSQLRSILITLAVLGLAACEPVPDFGSAPEPDLRAPQIIPVGEVLAAAQSVTIASDGTADLDARAEALRRRAATLRARQLSE